MMGCTEQIMFTIAHVILAQENVCFILILGARDSKTEDLVKSFPQSFDENYLYICFFFLVQGFRKQFREFLPNIIVTGLSQWSLIFEILQANDQLIKVVVFVPLIPRGVKFKRSGPNCCAPFLHGKTEIAAEKKGDVILYGFGLRKFPSFYAN